MLLLGPLELKRLHDRRNLPQFAAAWQNLEDVAAPLLRRPAIAVPQAGMAGWGHCYFCPAHNAPLEFELDKPFEHRCSRGGEILDGDLLHAVWWRKVNQLLSQAVQAGAILAVADPSRQDLIEGIGRVLLDYARYYPGYEVHGGIPFNGPGKANCQTLDEATWIILLAVGYNLVQARLAQDDCARIEQSLLAECAWFLVDNREKQLHNHQCWIAAAIGVLGLVLNDTGLVEVALQGEWGILEQLERGVLADGMWCEGSLTYHFYAFEAFTTFARLATTTPYAIHRHPALARMPLAALRLLLPDYTFPLLNDTTPPLGLAKLAENPDLGAVRYDLGQVAHRLEIALGWFGHSFYQWALGELYHRQNHPRRSLEALLYGRDDIQAQARPPELDQDYTSGSSGITILRASVRAAGLSYLLLKHNPAGGEHDHPDRPGLYFGTPRHCHLAADLGTVPYSLPWHYGYFKHTLAHNTVMVNRENQPPGQIKPASLAIAGNSARLTAICEWTDKGTGSYAGVVMQRTVITGQGYILDVFGLKSPQPCTMEYVFHWQAALRQSSGPLLPAQKPPPDRPDSPYSLLEPFAWADARHPLWVDWQPDPAPEQALWRIWAAGRSGQTLTIATAPDNPFIRRQNLGYWLLEFRGELHYFIHVFEPRYALKVNEEPDFITGLQTNLAGDFLEVTINREKTTDHWQIARIDKSSGETF